MKQGIHGFLGDHAVLRKLVILLRLEISIECFQISEFIGTFFLDDLLEIFGNL